jgi:replicative DNA helicase
MQTLMRSIEAAPDAGEALPSPFPVLADFTAYFRRGQVSVVAAASGVGKTQFATYIAVKSRPKIPTIYFSSDSDRMTVGTRVASMINHEPVADIEARLRNKFDFEIHQTVREATDHIWWCWDNQPNVQDIKNEVEAYAIVTGAWPHLIVVDNLINVDSEGDASHQQKDEVMAWLQRLAGNTNAHVMVLQHVVKWYENGTIPIPKSGLLDSVAKRPRLVITLHKVNDSLLGLRIVKNSNGKMDGNAKWGPDLSVMFDRSWMSGESVLNV